MSRGLARPGPAVLAPSEPFQWLGRQNLSQSNSQAAQNLSANCRPHPEERGEAASRRTIQSGAGGAGASLDKLGSCLRDAALRAAPQDEAAVRSSELTLQSQNQNPPSRFSIPSIGSRRAKGWRLDDGKDRVFTAPVAWGPMGREPLDLRERKGRFFRGVKSRRARSPAGRLRERPWR